jgi:hypothetical protein
VRRRLGPSYVPYATKNGVGERGSRGFEAALERDWRPYLNGAMDLDRAVAALIADVTSAPEPALKSSAVERPPSSLASPAN